MSSDRHHQGRHYGVLDDACLSSILASQLALCATASTVQTVEANMPDATDP
jgi:hypothetical protein